MTRRALIALLLAACGGTQREDDPRPEPGELDLEDPAAPAAPAAQPLPRSPPLAAPEPIAPVARAPRFRGKLIDLDVRDADLHNVFRLIAEAGGASIAVADDVKGTITLRLRQIPWDQALDTVVRLEKLALERHGDLFLVTR